MNTRTKRFMTFAAVVLTFWACSLEQGASAQSNCKKLKGNIVLNYDPINDVWTGPLTNAGILNGTYAEAFNVSAGGASTPDPTVFTALWDTTITTVNGQLRTSVLLAGSNVSPFANTEFGPIDPNTSTGRFAGATGTIFLAGKSVGGPDGPYQVEISGEVCFAP